MLEQLLGSKARASLLKFVFSSKVESFTMKDAARHAGIPLPAIKKEWQSLLDLGLVIEFGDKEQKEPKGEPERFCTNPHHVLFRELRALVLKDKVSVSQDFAKKVLSLGDIRLFLLTGIFLDQRSITQTDMLIVGKTNRFKLKSAIRRYEKELGAELFYTILPEKEYKYRLSIADHFLYTILDNKAIVVVDELEYGSLYQHDSKG